MTTGADDELLVRYLEGAASDAEVAALEARLHSDPAARRELVRMSHMHALCSELAGEPLLKQGPWRRWRWHLGIAAGAAAAAALLAVTWLLLLAPERMPVVVALHGEVAYERQHRTGSIAVGQRIAAHDRLTIGADASVDLTWPDGTGVAIQAGSVVVVAESSGAALRLDRGQVYAVVMAHHSGAPFAIATPEGLATDIGTEFSVTCDADGTTVAVTSGLITFAGSGDPLVIPAGREAVAAPGKAPRLIAVEPAPVPATVATAPTLATRQPTGSPPATAAPRPATPTQPARLTVTGTVAAVNAAKKSFTLIDAASGEASEYRAFFAGGEVKEILAKIGAVKVGDRLTVVYTEREGRRVLALTTLGKDNGGN